MNKAIYILNCILISLFLIQISSAVLTWSDFGGESTKLSQAQFNSVNSRFDVTNILTDSLAQGQKFNHTAIPTQPLVATLVQDENSLILQNDNYLQIYDLNLDLLGEEFTGSAEGQLGSSNFDGGSLNNDVLGFYRKNDTTFTFRAYNIDSSYNINLTKEEEFNLANTTTNGLRCADNQCYAYLSQFVNSTQYLNYLMILVYNSTSQNITYNIYSMGTDLFPIYEPPAYIDWDSDGTMEFLGFTAGKVYVTDYNGFEELNYNFSIGDVTGAKFLKANAGDYKIIIVANNPTIVGCSAGFNCIIYRVIKGDTTTLWEEYLNSLNSGDTWKNGGIAIEDYNGDLFDDVFTTQFKTGSNQQTTFKIFKGSDGSSLYSQNYGSPFSTGYDYPSYSLSIARMTTDSSYDFIGSRGNAMYVWDTSNNTMVQTEATAFNSCIPADLTYDNFLDIICTSTSLTKLYTSNYTNMNAVINSVAFDPSITIQVNTNLNAIISATDPEADVPLYYSIKCGDSSSWKADTNSNSQTCLFNLTGIYNVTLRVRDFFHTGYDYLSQDITVTSTGYICDLDGVCEAGQGETYSNCGDCSFAGEQNTSQVEGGTAIPMQLVDTENNEQGLLPSIYYGTLGFFSNILAPLFIIVVLFLSIAIILTIIAIAVKLTKKASNLG